MSVWIQINWTQCPEGVNVSL